MYTSKLVDMGMKGPSVNEDTGVRWFVETTKTRKQEGEGESAIVRSRKFKDCCPNSRINNYDEYNTVFTRVEGMMNHPSERIRIPVIEIGCG